ncbi:MAG: hypothetical protein NZ921_03670 [Candidatus Caldarchaeum sp.]|nr:hypothetical protein [Candidatus Caldarchaeum sp.]
MTSIKVAKEELERLIALCETVAKTGTDPYNVDVKSMLAKLRIILEKARNSEILVLDAETLYRVALIVALQHKWLKDRASSLFVDSQVIALKVLAADKKSLANAFVSSWRPVVTSEQLTPYMFAKGLEHFQSLPSKSFVKESQVSVMDEVGLKGLPEIFQLREQMQEELKKLHQEMVEMRNESGTVDYVAFVNKLGPEKVFERAYYTAFVVSEGLAELSKNPLSGEILLIPYERKRTRKTVSSLAVAVQEGGRIV